MKVGDYVRTENGIDKVAGYRHEPEYENGHVVWFKKSDSGCRFTDKDLPKSSPNIRDLIEVGDYVNGYIVNKITDIDTGLPVLCNFDLNTMRWTPLEEIDIWYSIVTKEQFESMEYKVGG